MRGDLTEGDITKKLLLFALPLMAGNLLQQMYNVADTLIVGRFLGADALAAVGSSYTLMVFLTSILLGLCMGSSAFFSIQFGRKDMERLRTSFALSFLLIGAAALLLNLLSFAGLDWIIRALQVPREVVGLMREYLFCIFFGIPATFLYNYFANLLRAVGDSVTPLLFLGIAAVMNIALDLVFVIVFRWGVAGAAAATVLSQYASGLGILLYYLLRFPELRVARRHIRWDGGIVREIAGLSVLTCVQQSIMNLGILMVQGLVNSFGKVVMAAFAAAVKIDSFAYMPVQDFGNAFSTFIAQNYGAGKAERIRRGIKSAALSAFAFCAAISLAVCALARPLMGLFVDAGDTAIIEAGVGYLRIEGAFYFGIGLLFLLYGFYRAVKMPGMSVVLTVFSLGTRVALAYALSAVPALGVTGIWMSVPIGWALADAVGVLYYYRNRTSILAGG
ncbi:MATE family efflux transporter [Intestinibacillus sp. NTUH-41-i26]|uniref:MATE family efflux transporter n=1 Tax=Butyricicoccaceae TaxID=3085642 RepID=UPI000D1F6A47|nr:MULTISPECIES: MATE family efflux transporter [Butyricicoccaceae]WOC74432.1 MATE family efflux transporter [Intestinibacillus sp. NTUH-41-i26]